MGCISLLFGFAALFASFAVPHANAARILALFPFPGKSHFIMNGRIVNELVDRGHEVDMLSNFPLKRNDTGRYKYLEIAPQHDFWSDVMQAMELPSIFEMHSMTYEQTVSMLYIIGESTTDYALRHSVVRELIRTAQPNKYDLILVEQFYQEAFLQLAHLYQAPVVSICTFGSALYFDAMFGSFSPWAHVPHEQIVLPVRMSFGQRVRNVHRALTDQYNRKYRYLTGQQRIADKHFGHLPKESRPGLETLMQRVSLMLMNSHAPLCAVRPLVPGLVEVGGVHIRPANHLPGDLQRFLDAATNGVIYFSFGTQVQSSEMPVEKLACFLRTFRKMPEQRILWKWEEDLGDAVDMPTNVLVRKWMPQGDILAHPNVRVFITHGGLLGTQEAVWHGVPTLGIPFYADQHHNTQTMARDGYGIALSFSNVSDTSLDWALGELLHNPAYASKARMVSRIFRDRPEAAIDRAMYWVEYVIRFGGMEHLRSAGADMPWMSYFLLDIAGAGVIVLLAAMFAVRFLWRTIIVNATKTNASNVKKNK